jgi:hypothetical protein
VYFLFVIIIIDANTVGKILAHFSFLLLPIEGERKKNTMSTPASVTKKKAAAPKKKTPAKKKTATPLPGAGQSETMVPIQESHLATSASLAHLDKKYQHLIVDDRVDMQALDYQKETMQTHAGIVLEFTKLAAEASTRTLSSIELQLMAVRLQESLGVMVQATNRARQTTHQSNFNVADYRTKAIDTILARRPANHQLLGRGADMKVPIHNPALGDAAFITDDAVFGAGMDFSIL